MPQTKKINVKRKQSVWLDKDLQSAISKEYNDLLEQGYIDVTVGQIIRKHLRGSFGIPRAATYVK